MFKLLDFWNRSDKVSSIRFILLLTSLFISLRCAHTASLSPFQLEKTECASRSIIFASRLTTYDISRTFWLRSWRWPKDGVHLHLKGERGTFGANDLSRTDGSQIALSPTVILA